MPGSKLVIFDVDGTLAEQFTLELLPGVEQFFQLLFQGSFTRSWDSCEQLDRLADL